MALPWADLTVNSAGMISKIFWWIGWSLAGLLLVGAMFCIFMYLQFNIKVDVWKLYGSGNEGQYSIGKKKKNRVRWIKKRSAWKALFPLFNKKEYEPFDPEFMYPGKQIYVFDLGTKWIPGRLNINKDKDTMKAEINPVPHSIRNWQSLEHKKNAIEFAEHNFWEDNKYFFMVLATAFLCLVMVGLTVYFTYKFASGGNAAMSSLTSAIQNFNTIPGR